MGQSSQSPLNFLFNTNLNTTNRMGNYAVVSPTGALTSLFGNAQFTPFPTGQPDSSTGFMPSGSKNIHNDDVYDTTVSSLIDYTTLYESMQLTAANFAYLKNLGVYPNNRLMVARKFPGPVGNDLTATIGVFPLATLISWVDNDADFMDINFGEHWIPAKASFEDILNGIGGDFTLSTDNAAGNKQLGTILSKGAGMIPLPGLMEGLQQNLLYQLGITTETTAALLPVGDPNLIKEGMQRKTINRGEPGSGLKCDFKIKMKVEYEQKYINGIDPTLAYFDIISNVLSYATSDARFMYTQAFATGANNILQGLISGDVDAIQKTLSKFIDKFITVVSNYSNQIVSALNNSGSTTTQVKAFLSTPTILSDILKNTLGAIIGKYKMAILGIIGSLTGVATTPWHITIGNPMRPFFSSGDMYMEDVNMKMGPILSFNDLPANITIEFTLKPARSLGAQEIFNRFNTGKGRTYQRLPDIASSNTGKANLGTDTTITTKNTAYGQAGVSSQNNLAGNGSTTPFI